jgi:hypothetical protein
MLYALLCSVALRPVKDWLVQHMDASLADQRRSIAGALLSLAALPLTALVDAWEEGRAVLAKWRQAVQEEFQRRQQALLKRGAAEAAAAAAAAAAAPTSPRTPRTTAAAAAATSAAAATASKTNAAALQTMPSLAVYGHAAVKVLKSRYVGGCVDGRLGEWLVAGLYRETVRRNTCGRGLEHMACSCNKC